MVASQAKIIMGAVVGHTLVVVLVIREVEVSCASYFWVTCSTYALDYGRSGGFTDSSSRKQYEEYDAGDWEDSAAGTSSTGRKSSIPSRTGGEAPKPMGTTRFIDIYMTYSSQRFSFIIQ